MQYVKTKFTWGMLCTFVCEGGGVGRERQRERSV